MRVTVIERHAQARSGCSFGNAGMVCPSHFVPLAAPGMVALGLRWMWNPRSPFYIKPRLDRDLLTWGFHFWRAARARRARAAELTLRDLGLESRRIYDELTALPGPGFGMVPLGLLMLCRTEHALHEESAVAARARELGIPADVLDPGEAAMREPGVRMDIAGAVHFPRDAHLQPERFLATMEELAVSAGVQFLWETTVNGWETRNDRVSALRTSRGRIGGDTFALCAGSWSPVIARDLGLRLPLQPGKGYSLTLPRPPSRPRICAILTEARVAVTPMGDALRIGGTMELAGLDESVNPARVQGIIDSVARYYPEFRPEHFDSVPAWSGLRPVTPDGLPYLGRSRRWHNLVIATGHAMLGLSLGPVTGRLVAMLAAEETPSLDLAPLDPERYG